MNVLRIKKWIALLLALCTLFSLAACGTGDANGGGNPDSSTVSDDASSDAVSSDVSSEEPMIAETVSVFAMTGPTGMGLAGLYADSKAGKTLDLYKFTLAASADEYLADLIAGKFDVACIPTNLAAVLAKKAPGTYQVAAVNTLGVLYVLDSTGTVQSVDDLKGKTVYATGEGLIPELCLRYVLTQNGLTPGEDVTVEFCSTAADVGALLLGGNAEVAMLPQPYVSSVLAKDSSIAVALDLTEEWESVADGASALMTGCLVVRSDFAADHAAALDRFMKQYQTSVNFVNQGDDAAAQAVVDAGIVASVAIAKAAIPECNITFLTGNEMKAKLQGFYAALYEIKPALIGGEIPGDSLYYLYEG